MIKKLAEQFDMAIEAVSSAQLASWAIGWAGLRRKTGSLSGAS